MTWIYEVLFHVIPLFIYVLNHEIIDRIFSLFIYLFCEQKCFDTIHHDVHVCILHW
jgi:hypothetical protein